MGQRTGVLLLGRHALIINSFARHRECLMDACMCSREDSGSGEEAGPSVDSADEAPEEEPAGGSRGPRAVGHQDDDDDDDEDAGPLDIDGLDNDRPAANGFLQGGLTVSLARLQCSGAYHHGHSMPCLQCSLASCERREGAAV